MNTMLSWTSDLLCSQRGPWADPKQATILDIGTGNGVLPLELAALGYANVTGLYHVRYRLIYTSHAHSM